MITWRIDSIVPRSCDISQLLQCVNPASIVVWKLARSLLSCWHGGDREETKKTPLWLVDEKLSGRSSLRCRVHQQHCARSEKE